MPPDELRARRNDAYKARVAFRRASKPRIRRAVRGRLVWLLVAVVTFPLGHWVFGKIFPGPATWPQVAAILAVVVVLAMWVYWELPKRL